MTALTPRNRNASDWVGVVIVVGLGLGFAACGGVAPEVKQCQDTYLKLLEKTDDEICSPVLYNHYENQVTEWRGQCARDGMVKERIQITEKLDNARICSDRKGRVEALTASCNHRLEAVLNAEICLGENECGPHVEELKKISKDCEVPELNGSFSDKLAAARQMFEERINERDRLQSFRYLIMTCDEVYNLDNAKQAYAALSQIIDGVSLTREIKDIPKQGSEVERFRKGAVDSCGFALLGVMEKLTDIPPRELEEISNSNRKQKRYIKKFQRIGSRLERINAVGLFPNAMAPLAEVLEKLGASGDAYLPKTPPPGAAEASAPPADTPNEAAAPSPSPDTQKEIAAKTPPSDVKDEGLGGKSEIVAASTAVAAAKSEESAETDPEETAEKGDGEAEEPPSPAEDQVLSAADQKKCKGLSKDLKHFTAKLNAYEKKGNEAKIAEYKAKQDKVKQKMDGIGCPET